MFSLLYCYQFQSQSHFIFCSCSTALALYIPIDSWFIDCPNTIDLVQEIISDKTCEIHFLYHCNLYLCNIYKWLTGSFNGLFHIHPKSANVTQSKGSPGGSIYKLQVWRVTGSLTAHTLRVEAGMPTAWSFDCRPHRELNVHSLMLFQGQMSGSPGASRRYWIKSTCFDL